MKKGFEKILGMHLVTPQTGLQGKKICQVLLTEDAYYPGQKQKNTTSDTGRQGQGLSCDYSFYRKMCRY